MKKHIVIPILVIALLLSGCASWWKKTNPNTDKVNTAQQQVQEAKDALSLNTKEKLNQVRSTAAGVDYALSKVTNPPVTVSVAKELNNRTTSIVGTPNVDELARMKQIVDDLTSQLEEEQKRGKKMLSEKDKEILGVQQETERLKKELSEKNDELKKTAETVAKTADEYKTTVDRVNSFFGLGGVIYGLKKFVASCLLFILIFGIIFLVLRILSNTNPIAKAAFMFFDMIGSVILNLIRGLMPNSISMSKLVDETKHNSYKNALYKIIDSVQEIKTDKSEQNPTLNSLLDKLSKNMNDSDKQIVDDIKRELRWK